MAVSFGARLRRLRVNLVLNLVIIGLVAVNGMVALVVLGQQGDGGTAEPLVQAPPVTRAAPAVEVPEASDEAAGPARTTFEELQSSLVVAQALQLQMEEHVTASELVAALPGLTFVNGFTAAGEGVIGVESTDAGILLLTRDASGMWTCAASGADGVSVLGVANEQGAVDTVDGCGANPR